jgi:hypothetical protein
MERRQVKREIEAWRQAVESEALVAAEPVPG